MPRPIPRRGEALGGSPPGLELCGFQGAGTDLGPAPCFGGEHIPGEAAGWVQPGHKLGGDDPGAYCRGVGDPAV